MSGIYLHIPFCKQACHYCDFHFSTSLAKKKPLLQAIISELILRKEELQEPIETIYFGGGTPSLLSIEELQLILNTIVENYTVINNPEITLEANPDDLVQENGTKKSIYEQYLKLGINRLSIGIQSFFETDLKLMNRAHNATEAEKCLEEASSYFNNITVDLIYGIPNMTNQKWEQNIRKALSFGVNHISSYALTVEPKTALESFIKKGKIDAPKDAVAHDHFNILVQILEQNNFIHYELSNFGKPTYFSKHNTSYWLGKPYLGIGPSAHSYNGKQRSWNVANNTKYIKALQEKKLPSTYETLSVNDRCNEYIMTGLRTIFGVSLHKVKSNFGNKIYHGILQSAEKHLKNDLLVIENEVLKTTKKGKFLCDGIAADLFIVD